MMEADEQCVVIPFKSPSNIMVAGQTMSGKSEFIYELLKQADVMFEKSPSDIMLCYGVWQPLYDRMKQDIPGLEFHEGLLSKDELMSWGEDPSRSHKLLVMDDLISPACQSHDVLDLFQIFTHHLNITSILVSQMLFPQGKYARNISRNCHYILLFNSLRDKLGASILARQMMPGKGAFFQSALEKATSVTYRCLVCDLHPMSDGRYRLRTNILPHQDEIIYLPTT